MKKAKKNWRVRPPVFAYYEQYTPATIRYSLFPAPKIVSMHDFGLGAKTTHWGQVLKGKTVKPFLRNRLGIVSTNLAYWQYDTISEEIDQGTIEYDQRGRERLSPNPPNLGTETSEHRVIQGKLAIDLQKSGNIQQQFSKKMH
jgi:hypothetical protein